jgi:hypothetical protein
MDDLHIGGATERELMENLKIVLDRLHKFNLKIQLSKTKFFVQEVKVLGVIYSSVGKKVDPEKVKAIQEFPAIDTLKKTQCFLGMNARIPGKLHPPFFNYLFPNLCFVEKSKGEKIYSYS